MKTGKVLAALAAAAALAALPAVAQQARPKPAATGPSYADENRDWGVAPATQLKQAPYTAPTPRQIPGGRTVTTVALKALLDGKQRPYLIDVQEGSHRTLSGAFWLEGAGAGTLAADREKRFRTALGNFAGGRKDRPMVFLCADAQCWLAYNAARRAIAAGYTSVMWYRGGIAAWKEAGYAMSQADPFAW